MPNIHEIEHLEFPSMTAHEKKYLGRKKLKWWERDRSIFGLIAFVVVLTTFHYVILPLIPNMP